MKRRFLTSCHFREHVFFTALLAACPLLVGAAPQSGDQALRQQRLETEQQWQQQQQQMRLRFLQQAAPPPAAAEPTPAPAAPAPHEERIVPPAAVPPADAACLQWQQMRIEGLQHLPPEKRDAIEAAKPRGCIDATQLNQINRLITQAFLDEGFFRVNLKKSEDGDILIWHMEPAKVLRIENHTTLNEKTLLPGAVGREINIRDLDQALDQANRVPGHKVSVDVVPQEDGAVVHLNEQVSGRTSGVVLMDNAGQDSTGRTRFAVQASVANPLGMSDSVTVFARTTAHKDAARYSRNASVYYSMPYGYWTFSANAGAGAYRVKTRLQHNEVRQDGDSWQGAMRAERVSSRDASHIQSWYGQIGYNEVKNRLMGSEIAVQSGHVSSLAAGQSLTALRGSQVLNLNVEYKHGWPHFGGGKAVNKDFDKLNVDFNWSHRHELAGKQVHFRHALVGQYSPRRLPSAEKFGLTDVGAMRGIRNRSVTGDKGYYLSQTAMTGWLLDSFIVGARLGLDWGGAQHKGEDWQYAASARAGVNIARLEDRWEVDLAVSKARLHGLASETLPVQWWFDTRWRF